MNPEIPHRAHLGGEEVRAVIRIGHKLVFPSNFCARMRNVQKIYSLEKNVPNPRCDARAERPVKAPTATGAVPSQW